VVVACLVGIFVAAGAAFTADAPEDSAQAAAEAWLRVVDGGDYAASWDQAAKAFKGAVKQAEWGQLADGVRAPLGKLVSRKLKSREYTEKMPTTRVIGGKVYTWGDGRYVVIQYDSVFANKASAVETVIPMADSDGVWRVSAYSIR
jgi:opacity protein-like surface antigen